MEESYEINISEVRDRIEVEIILPTQRYASLHKLQTTGFKNRRVRDLVEQTDFIVGALLASPKNRVGNDRPEAAGDDLTGVWVYENLKYIPPSLPPKSVAKKTKTFQDPPAIKEASTKTMQKVVASKTKTSRRRPSKKPSKKSS